MIPSTQQQEIWKPIVGFEEVYEVSDLGRIRSLKKNLIMAARPLGGKGKYMAAQLSSRGKSRYFLVHRLVAMAFIKNPEEKPCVNHLNNVADDNRAINLEWVSYRENTEHGLRVGGVNKNRTGISTVKTDHLQQSAIRYLHGGRFSHRQIAQLLDIPETTINSFLRKNI